MYALDVSRQGLGQGGSGPQKTPLFIFPVPVLLCEEAPRGEACPLGCLCVSGGACEWPSLVWSPQHFRGKSSGQLTPAVCRFAECRVCRPQAPFGWSMCCSDPPERWPEECALLGPRISYLWLVGHAARGGELGVWARLPRGGVSRPDPVSLPLPLPEEKVKPSKRHRGPLSTPPLYTTEWGELKEGRVKEGTP